MCLYKLSRIPRITLRNKIVYKIVLKNDNVYATYVQESIIEMGKTYKGIFSNYDYSFIRNYKLYDIKNKFLAFLCSLFISKDIASGYIHSFNNIAIAKEYILTDDIYKAKIIKCIIPRFTLYFIGDDNDFASRKLKYIEEIC